LLWPKPSPEKTALLDILTRDLNSVKRIMFGNPAFFIDGKMFTGVFGETVFLRLGEVRAKMFQTEYPNATSFEPVKGRFMKEYMTVPQQLITNDLEFKHWLKESYDFTRSLPKKK
jgi:TfoX/Sxy family transcriptional regulator of competence genes